MLKDFSCTSGDTAELNNILLHPTKRLIRNGVRLYHIISVFSVSFKALTIFQVIVSQRFISVFSVSFFSKHLLVTMRQTGPSPSMTMQA